MRIDRRALERIIQRAAELQAAERDIGDGLTEADLMQLGQEVGIPPRYLQRALMDERRRDTATSEQGLATWLAGPRRLNTHRIVPEKPEDVLAALNHWMTENELLTVRRRFPNQTSWESRKDFFSSIKRELGMGGRTYALAKAREISAQVVGVDDASHIQLVADLDNTRRAHLHGGATLVGAGGIATVIGVTLGVAAPIAAIPVAAGVIAGFLIARGRRRRLEQVQVAMEQVLDRLEQKEIRLPSKDAGANSLRRIAGEIKKNLGI